MRHILYLPQRISISADHKLCLEQRLLIFHACTRPIWTRACECTYRCCHYFIMPPPLRRHNNNNNNRYNSRQIVNRWKKIQEWEIIEDERPHLREPVQSSSTTALHKNSNKHWNITLQNISRQHKGKSLSYWNNRCLFSQIQCFSSMQNTGTVPILKSECPFCQYWWLKPGFHYPSWRPELAARVDGWPSTRAVLTGTRFH